MVDFQERDTRRSLGDDAEAEAAGGPEPDAVDDTGAGDADGPEADTAGGSEPGDADADGAASHEQPQERTPVGESEDATGAHDAGGDHDGHDHDHHAADRESVSAAILTVSTSRTMEEDTAGDAIVDVLDAEGHGVVTRELVNDDYDGVQSAVDALVNRGDVEVLITTGGTGVSPSDVTPGAVRPLFEKELPGFGEVFRALSYEEIGTRAIATRATAGIADGVPVFCLPGSEDAARLGTAEVIAPEVGHLVGLARPHDVEE